MAAETDDTFINKIHQQCQTWFDKTCPRFRREKPMKCSPYKTDTLHLTCQKNQVQRGISLRRNSPWNSFPHLS